MNVIRNVVLVLIIGLITTGCTYSKSKVYVSGHKAIFVFKTVDKPQVVTDEASIATVTFTLNKKFASMGHSTNQKKEGYVFLEEAIQTDREAELKTGDANFLINHISETGVYGKVTTQSMPDLPLMKVGKPRIGEATVITADNVGESPKFFKVQICGIAENHFYVIAEHERGFLMGDSGSPIVQNNKLVGAIAYINKPPESGVDLNYAICVKASEMLRELNELSVN